MSDEWVGFTWDFLSLITQSLVRQAFQPDSEDSRLGKEAVGLTNAFAVGLESLTYVPLG